MQFNLPSNLKTELISYDSKLRAIARLAKANEAKESGKPTYPLGNVNNLLPIEIVPAEEQQTAIDHINSQPVERRFYKFKRTDPDGANYVHAIIYHYESLWVAAWIAPKGSDYVFGYTMAHKSSASTRKRLGDSTQNFTAQGALIKYGRTEFAINTHRSTIEEIKKSNWYSRPWELGYMSWKKGGNIRRALSEFSRSFRHVIPTWDSYDDPFERIRDNSFYRMLRHEGGISISYEQYWNQFEDQEKAKAEWIPSAASILEFTKIAHEPAVADAVDTQFFRRWIQSKCDAIVAAYNDASNSNKKTVIIPWREIREMIQNIRYVRHIWPECPVDYLQNCIDIFPSLAYHRTVREETATWLNQNMPVASFFKIMQKYHETAEDKESIYCSEWMDTIDMLNNLLEKGVEIKPPSRWRIAEFHDHVQGESWKVRNPKIDLPQDLFPTPIKVQRGEETWTFFQPIDTHQLAAWGQAVRNCVGSASSYAEGVKKRKHFIVLAMIEGKPAFTVQLEVDNGVMSVKQIVGMYNARLDDVAKEAYTAAFSEALKKREEQLAA
jgi:hypothetical protein